MKGRPRKRKTRHLPKHVYEKADGRLYYRKGDTTIQFGRDYSAMLNAMARIVAQDYVTPDNRIRIADLLRKWLQHKTPALKEKTLQNYTYWVGDTIQLCGHLYADQIETGEILEELETLAAKKRTKAEGIRKMLTYAFDFGIQRVGKAVKRNPMRDVPAFTKSYMQSLNGTETPEEEEHEHMEHPEYHAIRLRLAEWMQDAMDFLYLTGLRSGNLKLIMIPNIDWDKRTLKIRIQKTRKGKIKYQTYEITDELEAVIRRVLARRPTRHLPNLFLNSRGRPLTRDTFEHNFQKAVSDALTAGELTRRYTPHDIRRKAAGDSESEKAAQALLAHDDIRTTMLYIKKKRVIQPLSLAQDG